MKRREYGQFCGLARAAEVLGQRWTLLILRDLLVEPRRYSDLRSGLPGIPTNILATRLKELEADGLVVRVARGGSDRSVVYSVTPRGKDLGPVLEAMARWGAADMRAPREGEVVTDASLVTALRVAATDGAQRLSPVSFTVKVADAAAHATITDRGVEVRPGEHPDPDMVIVGGPAFRDFLAGAIDPRTAVRDGAVVLQHGGPKLLDTFAAVFHVPLLTSPAGLANPTQAIRPDRRPHHRKEPTA